MRAAAGRPPLPLFVAIRLGRICELTHAPPKTTLDGATRRREAQRTEAAHTRSRVPTHQSLSGATDDDLLLRDLSARFPRGRLHGYDVTPAMVNHGRQLTCAGAPPRFAVHNVATEPLPHAADSVHLLCMSSVMHVIDEPLPVLAEIERVLAPTGLLLLYDWIRQPLAAYLAWRREVLRESPAESRRRGFRLFPVHNKYTAEDWRWLLAEAGFQVRAEALPRPVHRLFVAVPSSRATTVR